MNFYRNGPDRLQSRCMACQRIEQRITKGLKSRGVPYAPAEAHDRRRYRPTKSREKKNATRRASYKDKKDPRLPIGPFQEWLREQVRYSSRAAVARHVGLSWHRIDALVKGTYMKKGRTYPIKHVRYSTVDKIMHAYREHPHQIYDYDLVAKYRARYHDARLKRARS